MPERFTDILEANRVYAADFDLAGLAAPAAKGLGVLTCIDSRIEPLAMLGLQPGDAKILRNAGARVTEDAVRSLVLATQLLNVRRIMIVGHTDCALANTTDDELRARLEAQQEGAGDLPAPLLAMPDQHGSLRADVTLLRQARELPADIVIAGFVYDVETGLLTPVESD